jgi:hypothetical protein
LTGLLCSRDHHRPLIGGVLGLAQLLLVGPP